MEKTSNFHRKTQRNLGKRPSDVVPVGAWVELCPNNDVNAYEAVEAAQYEEERLHRLQAEKHEKLARFKQEVRSRVKELQKIKRQQQLQDSFQAVSLHRRVLHRTAPSADRLSQRKDACLYQSNDTHAIGHLSHQNASHPQVSAGEGEAAHSSTGHLVIDWAGQNSRLVKKAKQDMAAKQLAMRQKIVTQAAQSSVPGGVWGSSFTRDRPPTLREIDDAARHDEDILDITRRDETIPQQPIEGAIYENESERVRNQTEAAENRLCFEPHRTGDKHVTFAPHVHRSPEVISKDKGQGDESIPLISGLSDGQTPIDVYGRKVEVKGEREVCDKFKGHLFAEVNPGVVAEGLRRQHGIQLSMFRRLYSDMEREQVRETTRKKTHKKKIQQLKKAKEQERSDVEHETQRMDQPGDMLAESEAVTRQREEEETEIKRLQTRLRQKNKETARFIRALRAMVKERITQQGVNPPPLCACGPTVWDADPNTCANNCIFYRNQKAYAKALASVLTVSDSG